MFLHDLIDGKGVPVVKVQVWDLGYNMFPSLLWTACQLDRLLKVHLHSTMQCQLRHHCVKLSELSLHMPDVELRAVEAWCCTWITAFS